jgi:hypothetical protein
MPFITSVSGTYGYGKPAVQVNTVTSLAGSLFFNNNTNTYLNISPGVTISSGAYTVETWFYNNVDWASQRCLLGGFTASTGSMSLFFTVPSAGTITVTTDKYGGGGQRSYSFPTPSLNAWHHLAITRNSSQLETVFIDGVKSTGAAGGTSVSGGQQVNNIDYNGPSLNIAKFYGGVWAGYLTNMRINIGSNVYNPAAASVTIPNTAPLAVISPNTKYLMLGATVTADASSTQTVTNNATSVTQSSVVKPF